MDHAMDEDAIHAYMQALQRQRQDYQNIIQGIDRNLKMARARLNFIHNRQKIFYQVPADILLLIFSFAKNQYRLDSDQSFQSWIQSVCTLWRSVAHSNPLFWGTIKISSSSALGLEKLTTYLDRSGSSPLDLTLHLHLEPHTGPTFNLLIPHAYRWRRLTIRSSGPAWQEILEVLTTQSAPQLQYLDLCDDDEITSTLRWTPPVASLPLLSSLRLGGLAVNLIYPPLRNIRILHINLFPRNRSLTYTSLYQLERSRVSIGIFQHVMATMSVLEHLALENFALHQDEETSGSVSIPSLRSLYLDSGRSSEVSFLSFFEFPRLRKVTLRVTEDHYDHFPNIVFPSVRELSLGSVVKNSQQALHIIKLFPHIHHVTLLDSNINLLDWDRLHGRGGSHEARNPDHLPTRRRRKVNNFWPCLRSITLPSLIPIYGVHCILNHLERLGNPTLTVRLPVDLDSERNIGHRFYAATKSLLTVLPHVERYIPQPEISEDLTFQPFLMDDGKETDDSRCGWKG